jgi:hypothetical protein
MNTKKRLKRFLFQNSSIITVLVILSIIIGFLAYTFTYPTPPASEATLILQNTTNQTIGVGIICDLHTVYNKTIPVGGIDTVKFSVNHSIIAVKFFYNHSPSNWTTFSQYVYNTDTLKLTFRSDWTVTVEKVS